MTLFKKLAPLMCALLVVGCGDDNASDPVYTPPSEYTFTSRTNTDFNSSVSNEAPVVHALMLNELVEFMNSDSVAGLDAPSTALLRANRIYSTGTVPPDEGADFSLGKSDVYTGLSSSATDIRFEQNSTFPLQQTDFSQIEIETSLSASMSLSSRSLPYTRVADIDVDGTVFQLEVGDFIGWVLLDEVENGNNMPSALISQWLEEASIAITADSPSAINDTGMHTDQLVKHLILGTINYSIINQSHLASNSGLLKQNTVAFNLAEVEQQLADVETAEAALERIEELLVSSNEKLDAALVEWTAADPNADPALGLSYYEGLISYGPLSKAEKYYGLIEEVSAREKSKAESETNLEEEQEKVEPLLPYTDLAHSWDEAFGYFGAARNYGAYSDEAIVEYVAFDDNASPGLIDVFSELNHSYAIMAAERDLAASNVDYSGTIWNAFLLGREIIQQNHGRTAIENVGYHKELKVQADIIKSTLEKVIASTVIHYTNQVIESIENNETTSFADSYYQNWSALKGIALTLQFNDAPTISKEEDIESGTPKGLRELHDLIGDAPVALGGNFAAQAFDLGEAKDILQKAYNFAPANVEAW